MTRRVEAAAWAGLAVVCMVLVFVVRKVAFGLPGQVVLVLDFHAAYTRFGWRSLGFAAVVVAAAAWSLRLARRSGGAR